MIKVNLIKVTGVLLFSSFAILSGTKGYAYENGQNDPNMQTQEIKKQDSATLPAEGTFQEFDPTKPVDPSLPNPGPTDKAWIDVEIPTKILFGQTDISSGIISPNYEIKNLSSKSVEIAIMDFKDRAKPATGKSDAEKISDQLTLDLKNVTSNTVVPLHTADAKNPAQFPADLGAITTQGEKLVFQLTGNIAKGFQFSQTAIQPQYDMVLKFEVK
ncbi:hypothetical protein [Enterococcus durans]|uniref:hypothetical protein n=1 Tax=Enterococcus durans TaxID=53345 RepID=UPI0021C41667|nr:hypothetical protein [Enterococcus durans]